MSSPKVPFFPSLLRSQLGSLLATTVDFSTLYIATEFCGIYYVISAAIASGMGAIVGFIVQRRWAFKRTEKPIGYQAFKYAITSIIILIFNVIGIYLVTDLLGVQYMISKIIIAFLVGILISFPLFRYWVYD